MKIEEIKKLKDRRPFEAFRIRTADGRETLVTHPEAVAWNGGRIAVCVHPDGGVEVMDVALITSLALDAPAQRSNGPDS
jgi:hypothetical protein